MYSVYAIRSILTGRICVGQTSNLKARLKDHNDGSVRSTKVDRPLANGGVKDSSESKRGNAY